MDSFGETEHDIACQDGITRFPGIVGQSDAIRRAFDLVEKVADSDRNIVVTGETGTGKGLLAWAIHQYSHRCDKPFVQINCSAIPENLVGRAVLIGNGDTMLPEHLNFIDTMEKPQATSLASSGTTIKEMEMALILDTLKACHNNSLKTKAHRLVSNDTDASIRRYMTRWKIKPTSPEKSLFFRNMCFRSSLVYGRICKNPNRIRSRG